MFGCYRTGEANDPNTYAAAIAAILAEYDSETIKRVTDPRTGIARALRFLPNPAEVAAASDAVVKAKSLEVKMAAMGWQFAGLRMEKIEGREPVWSARWTPTPK